MSVPIPPNDQTPPLWRRLITTLLLAIWPAGGFLLLLGSAAGEESVIGRGFAALVEAPWWAVTSACMALVTAHSVRCPRQPAGGGRFCHRSKCARSDDSLGRRPCDDPGSGYSLLGIPVVFHRHRPDRCRLQPSGAACAPPATGWKRGIAPPPQTNSLAGGGAVSLFWQYFIPYPKYPAYASEVFLAGYLLLACRF